MALTTWLRSKEPLIVAVAVGRSTVASSTPSTARIAFSALARQWLQCIPSIVIVVSFDVVQSHASQPQSSFFFLKNRSIIAFISNIISSIEQPMLK